MHDEKPDLFVDELLDASLKQYRGEEPRPGLEMRILAGIRTRERAARVRGLGWAVAACAGILAVIAVTLNFVPTQLRRSAPSASLPQPVTTPPARSGSADPRFWGPRLVHGPKEGPRTPKPGVRATHPARPEQFPTPFPLTEQEKLLLAYLNKAPKADLTPGTDEKAINDLEVPEITVAALKIKPLDDSQSEQEK